MKKFLTVLLALSVVFTYSFSAVGTAFAATPDEASANAAAAKEEAKTIAEAALNTLAYANGNLAYIGAEAYSADAPAVSKTAVDQAAADLQTEINTAIQKAADASVTGDESVASIEAVKTAYYATTAAYLDKLFDKAKDGDAYTFAKVYAKQAVIEKAAALAKINAVVSTNYYDEDKTHVEAAIKAAKDEIEPLTGVAGDLATISRVMATFETAMGNYKTKAELDQAVAEAKAAAIKDLNEKAEAFKGDATKGEIKRLSDIISDSTKTPAEITNARTYLNRLNANVTAVVNYYTEQVNSISVNKTADVTITDGKIVVAMPQGLGAALTPRLDGNGQIADESDAFYEIVQTLGGVSYLKDYATTKAAAFKAELDADGTIKYYAATVDEALAAVIKDINALKLVNVAAVDAAFISGDESAPGYLDGKTRKNLDAALDDAKNAKTGEIDALIKTRTFSGERADKVNTIVKDAKAAIDAAVDVDTMTKVVEDAAKAIAAILDNDQIAALKTKVNTEYDSNYKTLIDGYVDSIITKNGADKYDATAQKAGIETKVKEYYYDLVLAKEDKDLSAAAVAEIMAQNYAGAVAVAEKNLVAKDTLAAAEKAINDQLAALDYTVNAETTPKILAAYEAYKNYKELTGSDDTKISLSKLNYLVGQVVAAEKKVITDKISAITNKTAFTLDDIAALEELKKDAEAFNEKYNGYPGFEAIADPTAETTTVTKIATARYQDAITKINAIPSELTAADKATVEAARAAYDALTDDQKKALNSSFITKLVAAETKLEVLIASAVEGLKITASSAGAKGSITVKWTVKGDTSTADGFEVFRSVKKNSGFTNKAFYTTDNNAKRSYKNTKSLKKGTRYYYKIRAYKVLADGTKVYSDWSNKAYRIAK